MRTLALSTEICVQEENLDVRPLSADDSDSYRVLRKRVLDIGEGKYFSASYRRDSQLVTEEQWREYCTEKREHCIIGIFAGGDLVGIMAIVAQKPEEGLVAEWDSTWIDPEYRGKGIAKFAYKEVERWTKCHGYRYAEVFIRDENARSLKIRKKNGAVYSRTKYNEVWADGSVGDAHFFIKDLAVETNQQGDLCSRVISNLESTIESLENDFPQENIKTREKKSA
ncbi:MAG: GNAT family N-acetyltransferase [Alphaproteobacteria bacterium]|nr:GNAT family N-acetyltransferase [Alphaproteobacteria bacterium]